MRKTLSVLAVAGLASAASAQSPWDSGTGLGFAFVDNTTQNYNISPTVAGNQVSRIDIYMNPQHTWRADMVLTIVAPDNSQQVITNANGGSGDFFSAFIQDGGLPMTTTGNLDSATSGLFYAASGGSLSSLNASAGMWTIIAQDTAGGDTGTIDRIVLHTVPTPGAMALLGLGGLVATRRRRA